MSNFEDISEKLVKSKLIEQNVEAVERGRQTPQVVIIEPTRELATQVYGEAVKFTRNTRNTGRLFLFLLIFEIFSQIDTLPIYRVKSALHEGVFRIYFKWVELLSVDIFVHAKGIVKGTLPAWD